MVFGLEELTKPGTCGSSGEVDGQRVPVLGDYGADVDVGDPMAVIVQNGFAPIDPILPGPDAGSRLTFGAIEDRTHRLCGRLLAIFVGQA